MALKVLHCIYDDPANPWVAGGGAVRVFELYRHLAGEVDATVATGRFPGAKDETIDGVRYVRLGVEKPYPLSRLTYAAAANRLLRTADYDAAVFDFSTYTPLFVPTDRPVGITVHHVTGPTADERWGRALGAGIRRMERAMIGRASRLSATSAATFELLQDLKGPGVEIDMVYAGVPDELFALPHREQDYLLYFGRLDVIQKGLDTLLAAFAIVAAERPGLELRMAGRGKDADRVREMARGLGVEGSVRLLGAVSEDERQALFTGALVQLMPSRFEGFGMVAAEAMAAGVPLVAAAAGSLPEVVGDGGVLVPAGDAPALAAAVSRLIADAAERARLSRAARASAERFRWNAVAADHLGFLSRIAAGARAPRPHASR
ncbi:MAG: phosphatidylinositol alpha-mannosyltransferase [Gemmatimonadetes bacterium]|nr:phosphatidylinositol alpha-mannosyltransferase [Gemmatimonadota bacterium]